MKVILKLTNLWIQIKEFLATVFTIGLTALPGRRDIRCCSLDKEYLSDVLSENDLAAITPFTPTFIVAQTGSGKSTLVMKTCLPVAMHERKKILFLGSRVSLLFQMKMLAMKDPVNADQMGDYIKVGDMASEYTPKLLKKCHNFGILDIYSYQELLNHIDEMDFTQYSFVIMDEAHFFVSDATFNCFTGEILDKLLNAAKKTRRIYFTATPEECFDTIRNKENALWPEEEGFFAPMNVFVMKEDYGYLQTTFLDGLDELVRLVLASDTEPWLIFVREKSTGNQLVKAFEEIKEDVIFMTADVDSDSAEYQEMLRSEKLPCRVLIATKVIDVGINIKTEKVNLVVFDDNPVEIKQMTGRKRIKSGEVLNLFTVVPTYGELKRRLGQVAKEIKNEECLVATTRSTTKDTYYQTLPHPLYADTFNGISYNELSLLKLEKDYSRLDRLLKLLSPFQDDYPAYKKAYAENLMANFDGAQEFELEDSNLRCKQQEQVDSLAETYQDITLTEEDRDNFSKALADIVGDPRKDTRDNRGAMKTNTINNLLADYGYRLTSLKTTPVTYTLDRIIKEEV